jgi:type I restriction enzyme S subunit
LRYLDSGSAQSQITINDLKRIKINLPLIKVQKLISNILKSFDDKIQLNIKINKNLEELAQALYKRWFVDFEFPNEKGEPYKSSDGEMVNSELGLIPKGWEVQSLGISSISTLIKTGIKPFDGYKSYIATADVNGTLITSYETKITLDNRPSRANMQPTINSLWFAKLKNSRKLIKVSINSINLLGNCIFSTGFAGLDVPKYPNFVWSFLISSAFDEQKNNLSNGTTMEGINNESINRIKLLIPKKQTLENFEASVNDFFEGIQTNQEQNKRLVELRDLVLPKLMSGEIEVPIEE